LRKSSSAALESISNANNRALRLRLTSTSRLPMRLV